MTRISALRLGDYATKLLAVLTHAAKNGLPCPGSTEINLMLCENRTDACSAVFRQLADAGLIRIVRSRPSRVIEIVATGKRTALSGADRDPSCSARHHGPHKADSYTKRTCLSCSKPFQSAGTHNRICIPCKGSRFDGLPANMVGA